MGIELVGEVAVELEELTRLVVVARERVVALEPPAQASVLGRDLGGPALIVPESGLAHRRFELGEPVPQRLRVKGNHGPRPAGSRSPPGVPRLSASPRPSP